MATLYWGGGTGDWNGSSTLRWYTDAARTVLATNAPTLDDDVVFDSASSSGAYTVTIGLGAVCRNWTLSGPASGNVTIAGTNSLAIYGSVSWASTGITRTFTSTLVFSASSGSYTINFGGITLSNTINIGPAGGASTATFTLAAALNHSTGGVNLVVNSGTFDTNGFTLTTGALISATTTYTRAIYLRNSTVNATASGTCFNIDTTNLTFDAGTSNFNITQTAGTNTISGTGSYALYNVTFPNSTFAKTLGTSGTGAVLTFNNLTYNGTTSSSSVRSFTVTSNLQINGTLQFTNSATPVESAARILWLSNSRQTTVRSIYAANVTNYSNITFAGIAGSGALSTTAGTYIGDGGGNSGIIFDAPKTVYWNQPAGGNSYDVAWATTPTGTPNPANFPLGQDTAVFTDAGINTNSVITHIGQTFLGTLDFSALTKTIRNSGSFTIIGDLRLGTGNIENTATSTFSFAGSRDQSISSLGGQLVGTSSLTVSSALKLSGRITLLTDLVFSGTSLFSTSRTLNLNGKSLTVQSFSAPTGVGPAIIGGGAMYIYGSGGQIFQVHSSATLVQKFSVYLTYSGSVGTRTLTFLYTGAGVRANMPDVFITAGSDIVQLGSAVNYCDNLDCTGFSGTLSIQAQTILRGNLILSPTMTVTGSANTITISSDNTGGPLTIKTNGVTLNCSLSLSNNTYNLDGALTCTGTFTVASSTFNTNNYNLTIGALSYQATSTKIFNWGSSVITLNPGTAANVIAGVTTGTTWNSGTSLLVYNHTAVGTQTISASNSVFQPMYVIGSGTGAINITASCTFNKFINMKPVPTTIQLTAGINASFASANFGGTIGKRTTLTSTTTTAANVVNTTTNPIDNDYLDISYVNASVANRWYAGRNSTSVAGANTNWTFGSYFKRPQRGNTMSFLFN